MKPVILDVLADRYASTEMVTIWSPENKIKIERRFWVAAMKALKNQGVAIPLEAIDAYEAVVDIIDLEAIRAREIERRHDVKARIETFNELTVDAQRKVFRLSDQQARLEVMEKLTGYQFAHDPFTSRDLTDNIEQYQIFESMKLIRDRVVATLLRFGNLAAKFMTIAIMGRSHNVGGQAIKLGKRFSNWAEETLIAFTGLDELIARYPLRGIKGPMGTQQDLITKLGSAEKAREFDRRMQEYLGLPVLLDSVGQVYPRSLDFDVVSRLVQIASGPANMAITLRLMGGIGLAIEGFLKLQIGSTAMPHKVNMRTCERIKSLLGTLRGFLAMTESLLGDQWNEGDVSCSVIRRIALPGSFFALDGLLISAMTVMDEMGVYEKAVAKELKTFLPLLSSTNILQALIRKGMGREDAHAMIKASATEALMAGEPETFLSLFMEVNDMPLAREEVMAEISTVNSGDSDWQIKAVLSKIDVVVAKYPDGKDYVPEPIL